jgi:flavin-dependent dehydrogenase
MSYDVHIIGAGPAGLFAGISAIENSNLSKVIVSEEHKTIGLPVHCSGLISSEGVEELSKIVDYKKIIINKINQAAFYSLNNRMILSFDTPKAYLVDRQKIDYLAYLKYVQLGGEIKTEKIKKNSDLKSKNIIGADGPVSTIARIFDFPKIENYAFCYQGDFKYKSENTNQVKIYLNKEIFGGFFGWIIPIDEENAKIGFGVDKPELFLKAKKEFFKRMDINSKPINQFSALIPLKIRKKTAKKINNYNVLLAGDSAGQTKASTGGGIYFSAMCGLIAGKYYSNPYLYEFEWKKRYYLDLLMHRVIHLTIEQLSNKNVDNTINLIKKIKIDKWLIKHGQMDKISKMFEPKKILDYFLVLSGD